ncbi:MAG: rhodanese-like domain-containing protein [Limnobacter sp.]|uniref:rhodanese-like domain-containing protein n=1 Tax=Limnobacter sp. TaxID=2003368 RepID=UPI00391C3947
MTQQFLLQNSWLIALAFGSGLMLVWPVLMKSGASRVSVAQATLLMNQKKAVFVDIRDADVVSTQGTVANARRIDVGDLQAKADSLSKNKETPVVVLCQSGIKAIPAAKILKASGYTDVHVLDGGINAWKEAGLPLKKQAANDDKVTKAKSK